MLLRHLTWSMAGPRLGRQERGRGGLGGALRRAPLLQ